MADRAAVRRLGLVVAVLLFAADQLVKRLIVDVVRLPARGTIELLPVFRLVWVQNPGISMGFLRAGSAGERWLLVALTGGIAVAVLFWLWRERNRIDAVALGLVLGGAAGNITDRTRLGYVADFHAIHVGAISPFMVFNVADAAITIGVLLLVVRAFLVRTPAEAKAGVAAREDGHA